MNQLLLDNFEITVSRAEDVGKLNGLILQLAVRGKLVAQDPDDEPASELLKRIAAEKKRLKIKSKPLPEIGEEERPFALPDGWEWIRLGNLAKFIDYRGKTPKKTESGMRLITAKNVKFGYFSEEPREYVNPDIYDSWMTRGIPRKGDVLFTPEAPLGNVTLLETEEKRVFAQRIITFQLFADYDSKFLMRVLMSIPIRKVIESKATGTTALGIKASRLKTVLIPVPPLAEQKRIVERVDSLLSQTRQLETQLAEAQHALGSLHHAATQELLAASDGGTTGSNDEFAAAWQFIADNFDTLYDEAYPEAALANVAALKQAILQLAVQGKLTRQDPTDEPASTLLTRIAAEKKRLGIKSKELAEIGEGERPYVPIELLSEVRGGIQKSKNRQPDKYPVRYLTVAHVQRNWIDFSDLRYFEVFPEEVERWRLLAGDNLIVEGNGSAEHIGRTAIFKGEIDDCVHQNHVIRVRPNQEFLAPDYLNLFLNSPEGRGEMLKRSRTTSGLYNLSVGRIQTIKIPLFSLHEQHRMVARVDALLRLCDELSAHIQAAQATRVALRDAVLGS